VVELSDHLKVLESGEVFVDGNRLPGQPDVRLDSVGFPGDVVARHRGTSTIGLKEGRKDSHGRRLPGAVRTEQGEQRSLLHLQVEPIERPDLAVGLDQAFCLDRISVLHPGKVTCIERIPENLNGRLLRDHSLDLVVSRNRITLDKVAIILWIVDRGLIVLAGEGFDRIEGIP